MVRVKRITQPRARIRRHCRGVGLSTRSSSRKSKLIIINFEINIGPQDASQKRRLQQKARGTVFESRDSGDGGPCNGLGNTSEPAKEQTLRK